VEQFDRVSCSAKHSPPTKRIPTKLRTFENVADVISLQSFNSTEFKFYRDLKFICFLRKVKSSLTLHCTTLHVCDAFS
jgi:hypothetical protein